jgi:hypothetical protein
MVDLRVALAGVEGIFGRGRISPVSPSYRRD